jgi:hypothetical protein
MATVLNRTTLEVRTSQSAKRYSTESWVIRPDLSAVTKPDGSLYPREEWTLDEHSDVPRMKTTAEMLIVRKERRHCENEAAYYLACNAGIEVAGVTYASHESDRLSFTGLVTMTQRALDAGLVQLTDASFLIDKAGTKHMMTVGDTLNVLLNYGQQLLALSGQAADNRAAIEAATDETVDGLVFVFGGQQ